MSRQTSKMAHDKATPSQLKQELRRSKRSKRSKKYKNELVKNLQLEEPKTNNKDIIHEEPNMEYSDPQSNSEFMDHMDEDEEGGEYCGNWEILPSCAAVRTHLNVPGLRNFMNYDNSLLNFFAKK